MNGLGMVIKPIKNNRDYREALKEIARLMDARPITPEGDRLDVLVTLVEAWEEKHWPIDSPRSGRGYLVCDGATRSFTT
jgi:HTH-type transcriptional regulator/antitoxin HigA